MALIVFPLVTMALFRISVIILVVVERRIVARVRIADADWITSALPSEQYHLFLWRVWTSGVGLIKMDERVAAASYITGRFDG